MGAMKNKYEYLMLKKNKSNKYIYFKLLDLMDLINFKLLDLINFKLNIIKLILIILFIAHLSTSY